MGVLTRMAAILPLCITGAGLVGGPGGAILQVVYDRRVVDQGAGKLRPSTLVLPLQHARLHASCATLASSPFTSHL